MIKRKTNWMKIDSEQRVSTLSNEGHKENKNADN